MSFRDRLAQGGGLLQGLGNQGLNAASLLVPGGQLMKGLGSKLINRRRANQDAAAQADLASADMNPAGDLDMGSVGYAGSAAIDPSIAMQDPMLSAGVNGRQFEPVSPIARNGKNDPPKKSSDKKDALKKIDWSKQPPEPGIDLLPEEKNIDAVDFQ